MKLVAAATALVLAILLAVTRPDWLLFLLAASACLLAGAFLIIGVGRTIAWFAQAARR